MSVRDLPRLRRIEPVVDGGEVVGMVSLVVTFSEFPHRSPAAGFWQ